MAVGENRRRRWLVPVMAIAIVVVGFVAYQWIIPRTNLEVRIVYHESPSGGGTGGVMNINVLLTNKGNREISELYCMVIVREAGGKEVARNLVEEMDLGAGSNAEITLTFIGSQYKNYDISTELDFATAGGSREKMLEYTTSEEQMNLVFVENIR